jgi:hypothetical protein
VVINRMVMLRNISNFLFYSRRQLCCYRDSPRLVWSGLVWSGLVWSGLYWSVLKSERRQNEKHLRSDSRDDAHSAASSLHDLR